jgi:hypothetical protein
MGSRQPLGGGPLRASPSPGSSAVPPYVPPPAAWRPSVLVRRPPVRIRRPSGLYGKSFLLAVLAAVVAGAWYCQLLDLVNPNSPRATAKAFMRAVHAGDTDRTQALCTAETQQLLAPLDQAARQARNRVDTGQPREASWRATASGVTGGRAMVTIDQTLKQGPSAQSSEFVLTLVQEDGKWRVDLTGGPDGGYETVMGLSGLARWH